MNSLQLFDGFLGRQDEVVCDVVREAVDLALQLVQACRNVPSFVAQLCHDPVNRVTAFARVLRRRVDDDALHVVGERYAAYCDFSLLPHEGVLACVFRVRKVAHFLTDGHKGAEGQIDGAHLHSARPVHKELLA